METRSLQNSAIFILLTAFGLFGHCVADDLSNIISHEDEVHVGVILDMGSKEGKIVYSCISMAVSDFYQMHNNYTTRLHLHARDSKGKPLHALSAAFDLLDNVKVEAIIGAQTRKEAKFLAELGDKAEVPVISLSEPSSCLPFGKYPFFIQSTQDVETCQFKGIAAMVNAFKWRDVILIYEDTDFGRDILPYMVDSIHENGINITYKSAISDSCTDDNVVEELHKLMELQTKMFIVHMSKVLVSKLLINAEGLGMMSEGYAWFLTATTMNLFTSVDPSVIASMQGLVGLKSYIPESKHLHNLTLRLTRKFSIEEPNIKVREPSAFGIWAYDSTWALAEAFEKKKDYNELSLRMKHGSLLVEEILRSRFTGLSGDFQLVNGKLVSNSFEIVNVRSNGEIRRVGFWSCTEEASRRRHLSSVDDLEVPVIWPGGSMTIPKGRSLISTSEMKLKVGVPSNNGFRELVSWIKDPQSNRIAPSGFCVDVFMDAIQTLPYPVQVEFVAFEGRYDDLIYGLYLGYCDAVVGDVTITGGRSLYVDFTIPYTETGNVVMVVRNQHSNKNMWIFLRPLSAELWITAAGFFILTGFVVWVIEHPINQEFQGSLSQQIGTMLSFGFSTLVFAHRERLLNNLSKFIVIVWVFVVLVLTNSYTATLTSMMTVQQIQLNPKGNYLGYQANSALRSALLSLNFEGLKPYHSPQAYAEALSKGSKHGGVSAIVDEAPYMKIFIERYPGDYTLKMMPMSDINGFGFGFRKGSPLVQNMSKAIYELRKTGKLAELERKWFGYSQLSLIASDDSANDPHALSLDSYRGLFLISGVSSTLALFLFFAFSIKEKAGDLKDYKFVQLILRLQSVRRYLSMKISDGNNDISA
ncbi:glutamate receptor 1.2 [Ziziphus jujuba]|uniref:Glutamate receptor n=1 Tax=Ziziphus jujuba TaxID=326968 RepID=A0ABM3IPK2_ZIZJJ|nr:glutamate receptor 1.2 [Ziziphus jujuba]